MEYTPLEPQGHIVTSDPYFALMANDDGEGFVHCGDGVLLIPVARYFFLKRGSNLYAQSSTWKV